MARHHGSDGYSIVEHLLFLILDELRIQTWQRTKAGAKNRDRPKPTSPLAKKPGRTVGGTDVPQEQVREWLAAIGPRDDDTVAPAADAATAQAGKPDDLLTSDGSVNG